MLAEVYCGCGNQMFCIDCDGIECEREHVDGEESREATCLYCGEQQEDITTHACPVVLKKQRREGGSE